MTLIEVDDDLWDPSCSRESAVVEDGLREKPLSGWTAVHLEQNGGSHHTVCQVNDIEQVLLKKTREEEHIFVRRLMMKIYGVTEYKSRKPEDVDILQILQVWLDPAFLAHTRNHINTRIKESNNRVKDEELLHFLEVELDLTFYGVTPTRYFNPKLAHKFGRNCSHALTQKRYSEILSALSATADQHNEDDPFWTAPMSADRDLNATMEWLRHHCSALGFVPEVSILSLDDDLLRLRSKSVEDFGLQLLNSPNKGLGPVHHGVVSLCTGLFLGGHVAARGESALDCVQILQRGLCDITPESQIRLHNLFAWDRGYGGVGGEVNKTTIEAGGDLIGTSKRINSFPYTFGQEASSNQMKVEESGSRCAYWSTRTVKLPTGVTTSVHALAYRDGVGNVVLAQTTRPEYGPHHWSLVSEVDDVPPTRTGSQFDEFETRRIVALTATQRSPEWFLLRQFRVTASAAWMVWKHFARKLLVSSSEEPEAWVARVLDLLLMRYRPDSQHMDQMEPYTEEILALKSKTELVAVCRSKNLKVSGNKGDLRARILAEELTPSLASTTFEEILLKCWFMVPTKKAEMKVGSKNEPNIFDRLAHFLKRHSDIRIGECREYGLLCNRDQGEAAFSPDGIALISNPQEELRLVGLEVKTKTTQRTELLEEGQCINCGAFASVNISLEPLRFKELINEAAYRAQILHSLCSSGLSEWLYVVASTTHIIRIVHCQIDREDRESYLRALVDVRMRHMNWIYGSSEIPAFTPGQLGHARDRETVACNLGLWKTVGRMIEEREYPLPAGRRLIPSLLSAWNRVKGGIEVFSRVLTNSKAQHAQLPPSGAIWLRMFMILTYNAYQTYVMLQTHSYLHRSRECTTYAAYQQKRNLVCSFEEFCAEAQQFVSRLYVDKTFRDGAQSLDEEVSEAALNIGGQVRRYKKRKQFDENADLDLLRRSHNVKRHKLVRKEQDPDQKGDVRCVYCCRNIHLFPPDEKHTRQGFVTSYECAICKVSLCRSKKRFSNEETCFELFHASCPLPDLCAELHAQAKAAAAGAIDIGMQDVSESDLCATSPENPSHQGIQLGRQDHPNRSLAPPLLRKEKRQGSSGCVEGRKQVSSSMTGGTLDIQQHQQEEARGNKGKKHRSAPLLMPKKRRSERLMTVGGAAAANKRSSK